MTARSTLKRCSSVVPSV